MISADGKTVLIIGSGPNAVACRGRDRGDISAIVAINNAWRVRPDWDYLIHPEDFPTENRPSQIGATQTLITYRDYVPLQNTLGGFVYAGGTMAFTAGYWALAALRPSVLAFIGCDMVYPSVGQTHFYGTGTADPLRRDVTLQSLEAKSARLALLAARQGCHCVNLSANQSRLVFPRAWNDRLADTALDRIEPDMDQVSDALERERALGYFVESGRYWEAQAQFDARKLAEIDTMWLEAFQASIATGEGIRAAK